MKQKTLLLVILLLTTNRYFAQEASTYFEGVVQYNIMYEGFETEGIEELYPSKMTTYYQQTAL